MEGRPIIRDSSGVRIPGTMDARKAAASALRAFLAGVSFLRDAGPDLPPTEFKLQRVYDVWPNHGTELEYPCASVADDQGVEMDAHNLTPTMLEETFGQFGEGTVLWKTDELDGEFQVDLFANDEPTRAALMAGLQAAFNPSEERAGVLVEGSQQYFERPVRLTLVSHRRNDVPDAVFDRERRVICRVSVQVDVVHLRRVSSFKPQIRVDVGQG